jgi:hypothetical protein
MEAAARPSGTRADGNGRMLGGVRRGEELSMGLERRQADDQEERDASSSVPLELQEGREARVVAGSSEELVLKRVTKQGSAGRLALGEVDPMTGRRRTSSSSAAVARERTSTQRQIARKLLRASLRLSGFLSDGVPLVAMR